MAQTLHRILVDVVFSTNLEIEVFLRPYLLAEDVRISVETRGSP